MRCQLETNCLIKFAQILKNRLMVIESKKVQTDKTQKNLFFSNLYIFSFSALPEMLKITAAIYNRVDALYTQFDLHGLP